jgi:hypothetical protein
MTGHTPNSDTNQGFLSTMHTMIDDLDTISSNIDENTYLRLVNGLQRLYNIHNSSTQTSSTNYESLNQRQHQRYRLASLAIHHDYEGINDISGNPIISNANPIISNANPIISNTNPIISNNNNNYDSWNENNPARIQENARISYTALYTNATEYWNQARFREFQENVIAR